MVTGHLHANLCTCNYFLFSPVSFKDQRSISSTPVAVQQRQPKESHLQERQCSVQKLSDINTGDIFYCVYHSKIDVFTHTRVSDSAPLATQRIIEFVSPSWTTSVLQYSDLTQKIWGFIMLNEHANISCNEFYTNIHLKQLHKLDLNRIYRNTE